MFPGRIKFFSENLSSQFCLKIASLLHIYAEGLALIFKHIFSLIILR